MEKKKTYWLCRILGHRFRSTKQFNKTVARGGRILYRCTRCLEPQVIRARN